MAVKIRLARHGKKASPFYHIVAADSRAPRDGKFIEKLGTYNPITKPATVELNFDRALYWVQNGALPSDTARTLLRKEGVLYMKHLLTGVRKGSFDQAAAEQKFAQWKATAEKQVADEKAGLASAKETEARKRVEAEAKVNKARIEKLAKQAEEAAKAPETTEEATEETAAE